MANLGSLSVTLNAESSKLRAGIFKAQNSISGFVNKSTKQLGGLNKSFKGLGVAIGATAAILGTVRFAKGAFDEFVKFENALLDLKKVMNESDGDINKYIGTVDKLSDKFATSASEVLQGAANFKQAGFTMKESFELQETALKAAVISELSVIESSELLISVLKGFDAPVSDATKILAGLNEVSNKYATSLGELGKGMAQIAPIAKEMGFTYAEVAGLLTPVIEVFRSGTEAGNALKIAFLNLTSSQGPVLAGLKRLKIDQKDVNGEMKSGKQIITEVQEAWGGLAQTQRPVVASLLAGKRQAARFSVAIRDMGKNAEIAADFVSDLESATKEFDIRAASTEQKVKQMGIAYQNLKRDIGADLAPAVVDLSKKLTELFKNMRDTGTLDAFGWALNTTVDTIGVLVDDLVFLKDTIIAPWTLGKAAALGYKETIDVIVNKYVEWTEGAGDASEAIEKVNQQLKDAGLNIYVETVDEATQALRLLGTEHKKLEKQMQGMTFEQDAEDFASFFGEGKIDAMKMEFVELTDEIQNFANSITASTRTPLEELKNRVAEITQAVKAHAFLPGDDTPIRELIAAQKDYKNAIGATGNEGKKSFDSLTQSALRTAEAVRSPFQIMTDAMDKLKKQQEVAPQFITPEVFTKASDKIVAEYQRAMEQMKTDTQGGASAVADIWTQTITPAMDALGDTMGDMMFAAWKGDMDDFTSSFKSFTDNIVKMVMKMLAKKAVKVFIEPLLSGGGGGGLKGAGGMLSKVKGFLGFHEGGFVEGLGNEVNAILQTGEGVLSRKQMSELGGEKGFKQLQKMLGSSTPMFHDGGIVRYHAGGHVEGGTNRSRTVGEPGAVGGDASAFIDTFKSVFQNFSKGAFGKGFSKEAFQSLFSRGGSGGFQSFLAGGGGKLREVEKEGPLGVQEITGSFGNKFMSVLKPLLPALDKFAGFMVMSGISNSLGVGSISGGGANSTGFTSIAKGDPIKEFALQNTMQDPLGFLKAGSMERIKIAMGMNGERGSDSPLLGAGPALFHDGGIVKGMGDVSATLESGEGVLSRKDMQHIGGAEGFNRLREGNGMTINVPVNVEGNNRLAGELQRNIEQEVKRTLKEFS